MFKSLRCFGFGRPRNKRPADVHGGGGPLVAGNDNIDPLLGQPQQESAGAAADLGVISENKGVGCASTRCLGSNEIPIDHAPSSSLSRPTSADDVPVLEVDAGGDHKGKTKSSAAKDVDEEDAVQPHAAGHGAVLVDVTSLCDFCGEAKASHLFSPVPTPPCQHSICLDCFGSCVVSVNSDGAVVFQCPVANCASGSFILLGQGEAERQEGTVLKVPDGLSSPSSSSSAEIYCGICMEKKPVTEGFLDTHGCTHVFCRDCIAQYIAAKVEDRATPHIPCPEPSCSTAGYLLPDDCRPILTQEVFDRWDAALCESYIISEGGTYCPYNDCSVLLLLPAAAAAGAGRGGGDERVTEAQCPHCHRRLCVQCRAPWHEEFTCREFQESGRNRNEASALKGLKKLAAENRWQRCPYCGFYVERINGCRVMKCRCRHYFCYHCASPMKSLFHTCKNR